MAEHIIYHLARKCPQLTLPISDETRHGERYRNIVLCGEPPESEPDFSFSAGDRLETVATPAGEVDVLSLCDRADFKHCIRALAHRCENGDVPSTMGASIISGLINWEKIRKHKEEYVAGGGDDWSGEFERFTSDRKNYRDTIIVLSQGYYSALLPVGSSVIYK